MYDKDIIGSDDFMGEFAIPLARIPESGRAIRQWFPLASSKDHGGELELMLRLDSGNQEVGPRGVCVYMCVCVSE